MTDRREFLQQLGIGVGTAAMVGLVAPSVRAADKGAGAAKASKDAAGTATAAASVSVSIFGEVAKAAADCVRAGECEKSGRAMTK